MKSLTSSAILSAALLSSDALAAFSVAISKNAPGPKFGKRDLASRGTVFQSLANNFTGQSYMATVKVGTPPQTITLAIDTGSSDTWLLSTTADLCSDPEAQAEAMSGCQSPYDSSKSSTYKVAVANAFDISYGDGSGAAGDYITDTFVIGGSTIKALEMGLAYNATLTPGLLGVGYDTNEASETISETESSGNSLDGSGNGSGGFRKRQSGAGSTTTSDIQDFMYPNIIDAMVSQGLISTKAYSLYLDDLQASTGSIIFGGLDSDKYIGSLLQLPIVPDQLDNGTSVYAEFTVAVGGIGITNSSNSKNISSDTQIPFILDSGTSLTLLPQRIANIIYAETGAYDDSQSYSGSGLVYAPCSLITDSPSLTFDFTFGSGSDALTIHVPVDEMVLDPSKLGLDTSTLDLPTDLGFNDVCIFGMIGQTEEPYILGDTFLRNAYVVYDLSNNAIAIAQTNFNSTESHVVDFTASATAIPQISGVASQASVTETATGALGPNGNGKTTAASKGTASATGTSGSGSGSDSSSSTSASSAAANTGSNTASPTKSAGAASVPAFDGRQLVVLSASALLAFMGGAWFLA